MSSPKLSKICRAILTVVLFSTEFLTSYFFIITLLILNFIFFCVENDLFYIDEMEVLLCSCLSSRLTDRRTVCFSRLRSRNLRNQSSLFWSQRRFRPRLALSPTPSRNRCCVGTRCQTRLSRRIFATTALQIVRKS